MSALTIFRDHARAMAAGGHTPDCEARVETARVRLSCFRIFGEWLDTWGPRPAGPLEPCAGECLSDADRALFGRLAAEVDDYLEPHPELFPTAAPAGCGCWTCVSEALRPGAMMIMIVCPNCGNKRCPRATHHDNACTGSNDPGQEGSRYA